MALSSWIALLFLAFLVAGGIKADYKLKFQNSCTDSVWLGFNPAMPDYDEPEISPGSLVLFSAPDHWTGSIWARTNCTTDDTTGDIKCETGDCGTDDLDCNGHVPAYPVTLTNLVINNPVVSYEISLNHGWNVPVRVQVEGGGLEPGSGTGPCPTVECKNSILNTCPPELIVDGPNGLADGCMSECDKNHDDKSCCNGAFSGPACQPTDFSKALKYTCPQAHTFPADHDPPTYGCRGADAIEITFCPI